MAYLLRKSTSSWTIVFIAVVAVLVGIVAELVCSSGISSIVAGEEGRDLEVEDSSGDKTMEDNSGLPELLGLILQLLVK